MRYSLGWKGCREPLSRRTVETGDVSLGGMRGPWLGCRGQREKRQHRAVLPAAPSSPLIPSLPSPSPFPSLSHSPQIETSQLEPEIARATSSRTVVYNKGL